MYVYTIIYIMFGTKTMSSIKNSASSIGNKNNNTASYYTSYSFNEVTPYNQKKKIVEAKHFLNNYGRLKLQIGSYNPGNSFMYNNRGKKIRIKQAGRNVFGYKEFKPFNSRRSLANFVGSLFDESMKNWKKTEKEKTMIQSKYLRKPPNKQSKNIELYTEIRNHMRIFIRFCRDLVEALSVQRKSFINNILYGKETKMLELYPVHFLKGKEGRIGIYWTPPLDTIIKNLKVYIPYIEKKLIVLLNL
jgi:hypothetical protein